MSTTLTKQDVLNVFAKAQRKIGHPQQVGASPRFVLFHDRASVGYKKVRAVLYATGFPYVAHAMDTAGDPCGSSYSPPYMYMRKIALMQRATVGLRQMSTLDLCAVPTLVDLTPGGGDLPVIKVDAENICRYLADTGGLLPEHKKTEIEKVLKILDDVDFTFDDDDGNENELSSLKRSNSGLLVSAQKEALQRLLSEKGMTWSDPVLEHVYRTELKAVEARQNARLARISLEESNRRSLENLRQMEAELAKSTTGWICDTKKPTVADYL